MKPSPYPALDALQGEVVTVEECAVLLRVHPVTIRRQIASGEIRSIRIGSRRLVPKAVVRARLEAAR